MKNCMKVIQAVALVGQLGFTLLTPPVVMALLGWWLQSRFGLGVWIMLVCLLIGLLAAASSAWQFYRRVSASAKKKLKSDPSKEKPVVYYSHE